MDIFQLILEDLLIGICVWERPPHASPEHLVLRYANPIASTIVGEDVQSKIGQTFIEAFPEAVAQETHILIARAIASTKTVHFPDIHYKDQILRVRGTPLKDYFIALQLENITELLDATTHLRQLEEITFANLKK